MGDKDEQTPGDEWSGGASLADVRWNGVNLAVVDWSHVGILGAYLLALVAQDKSGWGMPPSIGVLLFGLIIA